MFEYNVGTSKYSNPVVLQTDSETGKTFIFQKKAKGEKASSSNVSAANEAKQKYH